MERTDLIRHYAAELDCLVKVGTVGGYTYATKAQAVRAGRVLAEKMMEDS